MKKLSSFLLDIAITKDCMYIRLFKIFLLGFASSNLNISNAKSLTIGIHKLQFTFMIKLQKHSTLDGHGIS